MTRTLAVLLGVVTLVATGCSSDPGPEESRAVVQEMHDGVVDTVRDLSDALSEKGIEVVSAAGDYSVCGVEPASSVEFGAGAG